MKTFLLTAFLAIICISNIFSQQEMRLLRFPTIHGNQIVFTYAGDLYTVSSTGGVARKLTNSEGFESFPRFSPDGKWIAFTGQYDGNTEVYAMPSEGGVPKRLTYTATLGRDDVSDRMGPNNIVMGWKHDSKHIVFRSRMHMFNDFKGELYLASLDGDIAEQLPLPRGGFCSYSPDDSKLVYNRIFREFRTWKRYRGGLTDDIWVYDFASKKTENITNNVQVLVDLNGFAQRAAILAASNRAGNANEAQVLEIDDVALLWRLENFSLCNRILRPVQKDATHV